MCFDVRFGDVIQISESLEVNEIPDEEGGKT